MSDQFFGLKLHLLLGAGLTVLASGCATPSGGGTPGPAAVANTATAETVVCSREEGTGSRITATRCRKVADIESRRKHDREMAENIPTVVPDVR